MRDVSVWVAGVCLLALVAPPANAELITINIEGVVDTVEDDGYYLEDQIHVGDIITGWYTYDTDTPDSNPLSDYAAYYQSMPACVSLMVDGLLFSSDPDVLDYRIAISNGYESIDSYSVRSKGNLPLPNGTLVHDIYWLIVDDTANAIDTDALPTTAPILEDWQSNHLRLEGDRTFLIDAHVTSAVPEPVSVLLFAIGSTMMFAKRS